MIFNWDKFCSSQGFSVCQVQIHAMEGSPGVVAVKSKILEINQKKEWLEKEIAQKTNEIGVERAKKEAVRFIWLVYLMIFPCSHN